VRALKVLIFSPLARPLTERTLLRRNTSYVQLQGRALQVETSLCMTSNSVESLISKLDHWLSSLEHVRSSFQTQVSLLDSALSILNLGQPPPSVIQNLHTVRKVLTNQLNRVIREISDLNLARTLLITTPSTTVDYEHIFRLSVRRSTLRQRSAYYQELSDLFDSIYNYIYQRP
jgi:CHAD domain-containing protein